MNKNECKKYIKRAFHNMLFQSKELTPKNIAIEMENEMKKESKVYIAYAKLAVYNLNNSATKITAKQLQSEIDVLPRIYTVNDALIKSEKI